MTLAKATGTTDSPSSCRALATIAGAKPDAHPRRPVRQAAAFLTHLIATARHVPQARERRRAEPAEVIAAYRSTIARLRKPDDQ
jgi:hypothetical protein